MDWADYLRDQAAKYRQLTRTRAGFSFWRMIRRLPEPNAALCIGVEGETGGFKCLTPSPSSPAGAGLFFETPMSAPRINQSLTIAS